MNYYMKHPPMGTRSGCRFFWTRSSREALISRVQVDAVQLGNAVSATVKGGLRMNLDVAAPDRLVSAVVVDRRSCGVVGDLDAERIGSGIGAALAVHGRQQEGVAP
jgi:hypothetical protein